MISFNPSVKADLGGSWLTGYAYRKQHNITGSMAGNQTDYQMRFTVHYRNENASSLTVFTNYTDDLYGEGEDVREKFWVMKEGPTYKAWYTNESGTPDTIYYATSSDGFSWQIYGEVVTNETADLQDPCIVKNQGTYYLYCETSDIYGPSGNNVSIYTSSNGINWNYQGIFQGPNETQSPVVWVEDGTWHMFYEDMVDTFQTWHATSEDGLNWVDDTENNPVVVWEGAEGNSVVPDSIYKNETGYYHLFFHSSRQPPGYNRAAPYHAESDNITSGWTITPKIPIIQLGEWGGDYSPTSPVVFVDDNDRVRLYLWSDNYDLAWGVVGDGGEHVYVNQKCRSDFADIRFTDSDGTTKLDYWMQSKTDAQQAIFWVEIPTISNVSDNTIYVYYGSGLNTESDADETFSYIDDFEGTVGEPPENWNVTGGTFAINEISSQSFYSGERSYRLEGNNTASFDNVSCSISNKTWGVVGFALRTPGTSANEGYFTISDDVGGDNDGNRVCVIRFSAGRKIEVFDSTGWVQIIFNYQFSHWYLFEVVIDWTTDTFDVYVDDILELEDATFIETACDSINSFQLKDYSGESFYVDFIYTRNHVSPEPQNGEWGQQEEYDENIPPICLDAEITNMEGCGNWVFTEEEYYIFEATYADANGYEDLAIMRLYFEDGQTAIEVSYFASNSTWALRQGEDVARIKQGTTTALDNLRLQVTFYIYLTNTVLDALDVDIVLYAKDETGATSFYDEVQTDYFNIYNHGGHSILTTNGTAGRLDGGDVFDLYAYGNNSWAESYIMFRSLQHVKLLPTVFFVHNPEVLNVGQITYYVDYCIGDEDWITGWSVVLKFPLENQLTGSNRYLGIAAQWYQQDTLIKNETFYLYGQILGGLPSELNVTMRFWVDLWFNKVNASSVIGGRVNAYFYPMKDSSNPWLRWITGSNWGPDEEIRKESMFFVNLLDSDGNVIQASQIKLVKVGCKVETLEAPPPMTNYIYTAQYDVFDLTFGSDPMEGIQTPHFDETKIPKMVQGGLLGWLGSVFHSLITWLSENVIFGGLNLWQHFVDFMDTIVGFFGYPKGFTNFLNMLTSFWNWMAASFGYIWTFLTSVFTFFAAVMTKFLNTVATIITNWVLVVQGIFSILGDGLNTGVNIWNDLNLATWVIIIAIFYPVYLLILWEEKGIDAVINQLRFLMDVGTWLVRIFITVIEMAIRLIMAVIEAIPIIE